MENPYDNLVPYIDYFVDRHCWHDWKLERSNISFYDLTYVYEGKATYFIDDKPYSLGPGDFIFIPQGAARQAYTDIKNPMHCFAFNFRYEISGGKGIELPLPSTFHLEDYELFQLYREFAEAWLKKGNGYMLKARALFMLILYKLISAAGRGFDYEEDRRVSAIKDYILKNYRSKLDMDAMAQMVDLNTVYMGNLFKKSTGATIKEYTNKMRVHAAETLLSTGGYSVTSAAYDCGFDDPFYFSRVFKKVTGRSPSSLLEQHQK